MNYEVPDIVGTIGEDAFLEQPLYYRQKPLHLIYVNPSLFEKYFNTAYSFAKAKTTLENYFSVTIHPSLKQEKVIGKVYVDYQKDPTDIALDGNQGSGRAYFLGKNFNLKGEKTPLAVSSNPVYNNGYFSLASAIHETLISNVLARDFTIPSFETLALFDTGEKYLFPFSKKPMKCGLMVRVYEKDELYRISHRFVNQRPFSTSELLSLARTMGKVEGEKFMHRFIHGAWSIGNLSIDGNLIDFDTSFFVAGRNPCFSFTPRFQTNYFGFEDLGQEKILSIILDSSLNKDAVSISTLKKVLAREKLETIIQLFPSFMGIDAASKEELLPLVTSFLELSRYHYPCYEQLNTLHPQNSQMMLFDFSNFFRFYPQLVKEGKNHPSNALALLLNSKEYAFATSDKNLQTYIDQYFKKYQVVDDKIYLSLLEQALTFISRYQKVFLSNVKDIDESVRRAYIINEDRTYLFHNQLFIRWNKC